MDWLDLLAVHGTLKSLLQHHSSKAPILRCSAFFTVQLSHPYMTTGKTIALTRWTFVGKVVSLLLNMLSRLVITFLPRSKRLLISWLQSPSAVILEPKKINSDTVSPSISHEVMGPDAMILVTPKLVGLTHTTVFPEKWDLDPLLPVLHPLSSLLALSPKVSCLTSLSLHCCNLEQGQLECLAWDFPGGPVADTLHSQCRGPGFNPWSENYVHMLKLRDYTPQLKKKSPTC